MLKQSRLYTFIDKEKKFALYFLEGQKLIHDLVLTQNLQHGGFDYFRAAVLSVQLMLGLLKHDENFCFYLDSEDPYFRLKIEMNTAGLMRGMIYSDSFGFAPEKITGQVRLIKFQPHAEMPYLSTIELKDVGINEIINLVLSRSYQVKSRVFISDASDQSFMLHQLPLSKHEEPSDLDDAFDTYVGLINDIMKKALTDGKIIKKEFAEYGFKFLAKRTVEFKCGCSKDQMITNVKKFSKTSDEELFPPAKDELEVVCEYCKSAYQITRRDIEGALSDYH